jgi:hypothetical protein
MDRRNAENPFNVLKSMSRIDSDINLRPDKARHLGLTPNTPPNRNLMISNNFDGWFQATNAVYATLSAIRGRRASRVIEEFG